jgi:hypothetical protein
VSKSKRKATVKPKPPKLTRAELNAIWWKKHPVTPDLNAKGLRKHLKEMHDALAPELKPSIVLKPRSVGLSTVAESRRPLRLDMLSQVQQSWDAMRKFVEIKPVPELKECKPLSPLIAIDGDKAFQKRLATGEYRGKRRGKKGFREGCDVTKEIDPGHGDDSLRGARVWYLTDLDAFGKPLKNFCVDCGRTSCVTGSDEKVNHSQPSPGVTVVDADRPDLDMRPGDVIAYWVCARCAEQPYKDQESGVVIENGDNPEPYDLDDDDPGVLTDQWGNPLKEREADRKIEDRAFRMRDNATEWIKNAKLRGVTYKVYDNV